jgi:hypothetical protein
MRRTRSSSNRRQRKRPKRRSSPSAVQLDPRRHVSAEKAPVKPLLVEVARRSTAEVGFHRVGLVRQICYNVWR